MVQFSGATTSGRADVGASFLIQQLISAEDMARITSDGEVVVSFGPQSVSGRITVLDGSLSYEHASGEVVPESSSAMIWLLGLVIARWVGHPARPAPMSRV